MVRDSIGTARSTRVGKLGYGIDEPRSIVELAVAGGMAVAIGFVIAFYTIENDPDIARLGLLVGPGVGFLVLAVAAALYWSSQQGKVVQMTRMISDIPWGGGEVVLDLGCGRGLGMVLAGKRLKRGVALGLDLWKKGHLSGNDPSSIWANAAKERVEDKVVPLKGDLSNIPLADKSVDVVLSALSLHRLIRKKERAGAFSEISRVLKDGGRIGILDAGNGAEYARVLRGLGMIDISVNRLRFSSFPPFHIVIARKPYMG